MFMVAIILYGGVNKLCFPGLRRFTGAFSEIHILFEIWVCSVFLRFDFMQWICVLIFVFVFYET